MKRALIVDDREENLLYLEVLLQAQGWEVVTAPHGAEALVKARQFAPRVIVSDLLMPVMDGFTLLRQWKADERLRMTPFVVYTATYTDAEDERLALALGADAFILKSAEPDDFMERLLEVMTRAAAAPAPSTAAAGDDAVLLKVYSETLIRKLEEKSLLLEQANQRLQQDIARLEAADANLRESELRFRQLAENISEVFWISDPDKHQVLYVSPAYERIWGRASEALYASPHEWLEAIHPEDLPRVAEEANRQAAGTYDATYRILRPDGSLRWIRDRAFPVLDAHGVPYRIVGTAQDITAERLAQQALEASEREQRTLAHALDRERTRLQASQAVAKLGGWETRMDTLEVTWSTETFRIFGKIPGAFQPTHAAFLALVHPEDRERVEAAFKAAVDAAPRSIGHRIVVDGRVKHIEERWQVAFDAQGLPTHSVGTCQDISERVLLEGQLRQSQRLEALGQLTGGVAHDFNNLLTVVMGNAEVLAENLAGDARLGPVANLVVEAAARGAELVRGLLAFSRKQALDPRSVDVNALLSRLHPLLRHALGDRAELRVIPAAGLAAAMIDTSQLESAILNLAINARDAMPSGGRLVIETGNATLDDDYCAAHPYARPGTYIMVAVTDNGVGIPRQNLARVFEPFFTTKEAGRGTGLGLAMVYGFVKQTGGHVQIYSEPGQGTTVRLYLPRSPASGEAAPRHAAGGARGGSETILLVDDDDMVRQYAQSNLVALGYRVIAAHGGERALEVLRGGEKVDLLFTDLVMPGVSGSVLAEAARRLRPELRVLYTSGYADGALTTDGRLEAGVKLLSKPYGRADLAAKVRDALD